MTHQTATQPPFTNSLSSLWCKCQRIATALCFLAGGVLIASATGKVIDHPSGQTLVGMLPNPVLAALVGVEYTVGSIAVLHSQHVQARLLIGILFAVFAASLLTADSFLPHDGCGCFGSTTNPNKTWLLTFDAIVASCLLVSAVPVQTWHNTRRLT